MASSAPSVPMAADKESQDDYPRDGVEEMRKLHQFPALPEVRKIQQKTTDTQHRPGEHRDPLPSLLAGIEFLVVLNM